MPNYTRGTEHNAYTSQWEQQQYLSLSTTVILQTALGISTGLEPALYHASTGLALNIASIVRLRMALLGPCLKHTEG